jgi:hypothetical protein
VWDCGTARITVLVDVGQESSKILLPPIGVGVPCPAGQGLKPALTIGVKSAFRVEAALHIDPVAKSIAIDGAGSQDAGITVLVDVGQESSKILLPPIDTKVPCPAGQGLKPALTIGVKSAFGVEAALSVDPTAKPTDSVRARHARITVLVDIGQESSKILLPLIGVGVPGPVRQGLELALAIGVKSAFRVRAALHLDPPTEWVAIDLVGFSDARVTMSFDVLLESAEAFLPLVGVGVPCPAGQGLKPALAIGVKRALSRW